MTSAIGSAPARADDSAGFTLIETLVTLAVIGLVSAIAFPAAERMLDRQRVAGASAEAELALRLARAEAISGSARVRVIVDHFRVGSARQPVARTSAAEIRLPRDGMTFYEDGSSTGGTVRIQSGGYTAQLAVDAPSGMIGSRP